VRLVCGLRWICHLSQPTPFVSPPRTNLPTLVGAGVFYSVPKQHNTFLHFVCWVVSSSCLYSTLFSPWILGSQLGPSTKDMRKSYQSPSDHGYFLPSRSPFSIVDTALPLQFQRKYHFSHTCCLLRPLSPFFPSLLPPHSSSLSLFFRLLLSRPKTSHHCKEIFGPDVSVALLPQIPTYACAFRNSFSVSPRRFDCCDQVVQQQDYPLAAASDPALNAPPPPALPCCSHSRTPPFYAVRPGLFRIFFPCISPREPLTAYPPTLPPYTTPNRNHAVPPSSPLLCPSAPRCLFCSFPSADADPPLPTHTGQAAITALYPLAF